MKNKSLAFSLTSVILGVFGTFLAFFGWMSIVGMAMSIVSIILSSLHLKSEHGSLAVTGLVFGIIGVSACVLGLGITFIIHLATM